MAEEVGLAGVVLAVLVVCGALSFVMFWVVRRWVGGSR